MSAEELQQKIIQHIQPTGLNSRFEFSDLNFNAYISAIKNMMALVNKKYELKLTKQQIELNCPFEFKPKKPNGKGMLLIHGLFDTPFIMRDLGKHYAKQGFLVRSILLPGHGTIPADLLTTAPKYWFDATTFGVESLAKDVDNIYITGFSTGAMLALHNALQPSPSQAKIKGLIMLSPAFAIDAKKSVLVNLYRMVSWMFTKQKWVFNDANPDFAKYTSFPVNSAYLVQRVIVETKLLLNEHEASLPIFIAMSRDDETVRPEAALVFFASTYNHNNRFILYSNERERFNDPRIQVTKSALPEKDILDLSHVSLPISASNPHYGVEGDYQTRLCEPAETNHDSTIYLGALSPENVRQHRIKRIMYNPFYDDMLKQIDAFITETSL